MAGLAGAPAPLEGHESAGQEKYEEVFLADEGRREIIGKRGDKNTVP